ncbi:MAG: SRPBCC family protein [Acidimicrobiales bacterium]
MKDILQREVDVSCDVESAWQRVVDPLWLGDDGEFDVVPGGEGWVSEGEETRFLVFEEVVDERHLSFRWASALDAPSRVDIDLEPTQGGTRISISESPLEARAMASLVAG